jgi:hypothetical protein
VSESSYTSNLRKELIGFSINKMSSPFKRFGRAFDNFKGGLKQIGSAALPVGMVQSAQPQRILAHPQTGQLILKGMTIQPEEGMYSVFYVDDIEILVRYGKILAYTLPQAPSWKDTEMVYVSPKLDALNLHKGASFTVFVGRVHYLVTVIERLAKTLPKYTRPSEELLEDQAPQLQQEHTQILRRKVTAPHTPRMNPDPQDTLLRSEPQSSNDKVLKRSANLTNTMDEIKFTQPTPIPPKTPKYNSLAHGIASSRVPPTPISPLNLKDRTNQSKRETEDLPTRAEMAKQSGIITMKSESRKTSPLTKQLPSLPLSEYPPTDINGEDRTEPTSSPQASRSTSTTSLVSTYSSEQDYGNYLNHAEAVTSKTYSTEGSRKRTSKRKSTSSTLNLNTNEGTRSRQSGKKPLSKIPLRQRFVKPTVEQSQIVDEYFVRNGCIQYSQTQPGFQQSPPTRKVSSPLPPLRNANDEIVEPNSIPSNMLPIGAGRINLSETHGLRDVPVAGPSRSTRTTHLYSGVPSPNLSQKQRKGKEPAIQPPYLSEEHDPVRRRSVQCQ